MKTVDYFSRIQTRNVQIRTFFVIIYAAGLLDQRSHWQWQIKTVQILLKVICSDT